MQKNSMTADLKIEALPQVLLHNIAKGGDFMERLTTGPQPVNPDKAIVSDGRHEPTHPLVKGRTRFDSALELVEVRLEGDQIRKDWSLFNAAGEMDSVVPNISEVYR